MEEVLLFYIFTGFPPDHERLSGLKPGWMVWLNPVLKHGVIY